VSIIFFSEKNSSVKIIDTSGGGETAD